MHLHELRALWANCGLSIRRGAAQSQIALLVASSPYPMPRAVLSYFEFIDGMEEDDMGPELIRFWTIDEVMKSKTTEGNSVCFDIADVSILADLITLRVTEGTARVVGRWEPKPDRVIAETFEEFIALYVADPDAVVRRMNS